MSSTERDIQEEDEESKKKKVRGETGSTVAEEVEGVEVISTPPADGETKDVQEVTQGVKEVELEDTKTEAKPETVPLPAEEAGELEESTLDKEETAPSVDKVEEETQHASKEVALDDAAQGKEAENNQAKDATSASQSTGNSSSGPTDIETNDS